MSPRSAWIACAAVALTALIVPVSLAQIAKQGNVRLEQTRFESPMVLETVFAAADRSLWDPAQGHPVGEWFSAREYEELGRYSCEGVFLRHKYNRRQESWQPGLAMSVTPAPNGRLKIQVRADVDNPDDNDDRRVETLFEVIQDGKVIASRAVMKAIEEGDEKSFIAPFELASSELARDPMTKLRVTVRVIRD
jgi:hypothetical protein